MANEKIEQQETVRVDTCCCPPEAGSAACDLPAPEADSVPPTAGACPECGRAGKGVQMQTVKALLKITLHSLRQTDYLFCRTETCPVVYFTVDGEQTFTTAQVRERVYQKEPEADGIFVCYCFRHTVGDVRDASPEAAAAIVADINAGIQAGRCACALRNPQGSCCLGNIHSLIKRLAGPSPATEPIYLHRPAPAAADIPPAAAGRRPASEQN